MNLRLSILSLLSVAVLANSGCALFERQPRRFKPNFDAPPKIVLRAGAPVKNAAVTNETPRLVAPPAPEAPRGSTNAPAMYRIKERDQFVISIKPPAPDRDIEYRGYADSAGVELWPLTGTILLLGKTPAEVEAEIRRQYVDVQKIYRAITVNVSVPQTSVYVGGEVRHNGRFELTAGLTFLKAIDSAEGFTDWADKTRVQLNRRGKVTTYNVKKMRENPALDFELEPEDQITVPRS